MLGAVLFGAVPAFMGAHTALEGGLLVRGAEFAFISLASTAMAALCVRLIPQARAWWGPWLRALLTGLILTVPMGLIVWGIDRLFAAHKPGVDLILGYIWISFGISMFFSLLAAYFAREPIVVVTHAAPASGPEPVRFLERLPLKLRGSMLWAVEAEDHYLRLHTSKGQDLILMRLSDAIAELEGIEGAQVHRSWWIARDAIADIARGDGRATLTLQDGSQVPVSRTYAKLLREKGWL